MAQIAQGKPNKYLLAIFLLTLLVVKIQSWDFSIERIESAMNGTNKVILEFQHRRYNRTLFLVSANLTVPDDLVAEAENYTVNVAVFYSVLGNNQFRQMPFGLNSDICSFLNGQYRKYALPSVKPPATDLPYTEDDNVDICQIFKQNGGKKYTGNNMILDNSKLPNMPSGLYKGVVTTTYAPTNTPDTMITAIVRVF